MRILTTDEMKTRILTIAAEHVMQQESSRLEDSQLQGKFVTLSFQSFHFICGIGVSFSFILSNSSFMFRVTFYPFNKLFHFSFSTITENIEKTLSL